METMLFFRSRLPRPVAPAQWLSVLILFVVCLLLPVGALARTVDTGEARADCIDSFLRYLKGDLQASHLKPGLKDAERRADCVDFFVEKLAGFDAAFELQRGKPPTLPPPPSSPPARYWHVFTGNDLGAANASRLYLFGGNGDNWRVVANDLWYYRVDQARWLIAPSGSTRPGSRAHLGFSCGAGSCVAANGTNGVSWLKETWTYSEALGSWSQVNCKRNLCPSARGMPTMAYDPAHADHVLFGGLYGSSSLDDTYTYAAGRWTAQKPRTVPAPRDRAAAAFAPGAGTETGYVVMHGGQYDGSGVLCDMYAWTGTDWLKIGMTGQVPCLHSHSMVWDGTRLVVTGGYVDTSDTPNKDVWYFNFSTGSAWGAWSKNTEAGFKACAAGAEPGARMAYDIPGKAFVFFGGVTNEPGGAVAKDTMVVCP